MGAPWGTGLQVEHINFLELLAVKFTLLPFQRFVRESMCPCSLTTPQPWHTSTGKGVWSPVSFVLWHWTFGSFYSLGGHISHPCARDSQCASRPMEQGDALCHKWEIQMPAEYVHSSGHPVFGRICNSSELKMRVVLHMRSGGWDLAFLRDGLLLSSSPCLSFLEHS